MMSFVKKYFKFFVLFNILLSDQSWKLYENEDISTIDVMIDWESIDWMYDNVESDSMFMASIHFSNIYINETLDSVGFRLRGNTSRHANKKSFKIDFNYFVENRYFYDVEKLNLNGEHNDPSIVRSKLAWDYFQEIGMASSRASHIMLYINGIYFGLYMSVEHIDETFLKRNFDNDNGNLWKCTWPADLSFRGNQPQDYYPYFSETRPYELKTNKDEYDYSRLAQFIQTIHNTTDSLDITLNIKTTMQYFAMNILMGSWDDYRFLQNNFYLYHNPANDLIHIIPYDYDNTFGIDWFEIDWSMIDPYTYSVNDDSGRPLTDYLFSQSRYKNLFSHFLEFYNHQLFNIDSVDLKLEYYKEFLFPAALEDTFRTLDYDFTISDFLNSYGDEFENQHVKNGIFEYISQRKESLDNLITFDGNVPFVYDKKVYKGVLTIGDTASISAAIFGDIDNAELFYRLESFDEWNSVSMEFNPFIPSKRVEDHDRWVARFEPTLTGDYEWYILASNANGSDRFPIIGYDSFKVVDLVDELPVVINELLAKNNFSNVDGFGESDDWIELFNYSNYNIDLSNHYMTDKVEDLVKWKFPDSISIIGPEQHLLIWCDEEEYQGPFHTNFKLSSTGEFLALISPDGETILDSLTFPAQSADISYGRTWLNDNEWTFMNPSPGVSNVTLTINNTNLSNYGFNLNSVYPNPFNSTFNIELIMDDKLDNVEINLFTLLGKNILNKKFYDINTGINTFPINMENGFSSGSYMLQIKNDKKSLVKKLIYLK